MSSSGPSQPGGSRTMTIESTSQPQSGPSQPHHRDRESADTVGVLKLRGAPARRQKVMWTEETVDNEGMGKKKSKICCIYHRPKAYDESSTESDSSCSDSEGHAHSHTPRRRGKQATRRKADGGEGEVEHSSSSESEGGQGDGRAKPAKRTPRHLRPHDHTTKPNKYDHQAKGHQPAAVKG